MSEKHDQTRAMLNDENHPPRTRIDDNQPPARKVSGFLIHNYLNQIDLI
jgi:hypothetical protein